MIAQKGIIQLYQTAGIVRCLLPCIPQTRSYSLQEKVQSLQTLSLTPTYFGSIVKVDLLMIKWNQKLPHCIHYMELLHQLRNRPVNLVNLKLSYTVGR